MDLKTARKRYWSQQHNAKRRGIEWRLTFQQWLDWWGPDLDNRGQRAWNLQMQRIGDQGAYELGNIRKGHPKDNSKTYSLACQNRKAAALARAHQDALDAAPVEAEDYEEEDESISGYFSRDPGWSKAHPGQKWDRLHRGNT